VMGGDIDAVERLFQSLEQRGRQALQRYGLADDTIAFLRSADMRYHRQAYEINVRLQDGALDSSHQASIAETFHQVHERLYGRRDKAGVIQFVTLCVTAVGNTRRLAHQPLPQGDGSLVGALKSSRRVFFRDTGMTECPCFDRASLRAGDALSGPALIEAVDSTTVVPSGWAVHCDAIGNLMITRERPMP
jgi:N-methylhydantoinase A